MPRLETYTAYWREYPPTHVMVQNIALWLGAYKRPIALPVGKNVQNSVDDMKALFPSGIRAADLA